MSCDMFSSFNAQELLKGKIIHFFGGSNIRALYKDLLWLLEDGRLIPNQRLKSKNEMSHANDVRLSNGTLHSGRHYEEVRCYNENPYINFTFITRLYLTEFIKTIQNLETQPDVIFLNSCLWDLTRWGSNGVQQYKQNINATFRFLKKQLPSTRIIWLSTLPASFRSHGGYLTKEIAFLRNMLPWHISFANKYASDVAASYSIDVLDLHFNFRFLLNYHAKDGIHWDPKAVRHGTNLLLTHLALCWNFKLPGRFKLDQIFVEDSERLERGGQKMNFRKKSTKRNRRPYSRSRNVSPLNYDHGNNYTGASNTFAESPPNLYLEDYFIDNFYGRSQNDFSFNFNQENHHTGTSNHFMSNTFANGRTATTPNVDFEDYFVNDFYYRSQNNRPFNFNTGTSNHCMPNMLANGHTQAPSRGRFEDFPVDSFLNNQNTLYQYNSEAKISCN